MPRFRKHLFWLLLPVSVFSILHRGHRCSIAYTAYSTAAYMWWLPGRDISCRGAGGIILPRVKLSTFLLQYAQLLTAQQMMMRVLYADFTYLTNLPLLEISARFYRHFWLPQENTAKGQTVDLPVFCDKILNNDGSSLGAFCWQSTLWHFFKYIQCWLQRSWSGSSNDEWKENEGYVTIYSNLCRAGWVQWSWESLSVNNERQQRERLTWYSRAYTRASSPDNDCLGQN